MEEKLLASKKGKLPVVDAGGALVRSRIWAPGFTV
jgi:hypothetical protein